VPEKTPEAAASNPFKCRTEHFVQFPAITTILLLLTRSSFFCGFPEIVKQVTFFFPHLLLRVAAAAAPLHLQQVRLIRWRAGYFRLLLLLQDLGRPIRGSLVHRQQSETTSVSNEFNQQNLVGCAR
jgi:hypothetical protein